MTYDLHIADRLYSSWSFRGWLLFDAFDLDCTVHLAGLYEGTMAQDLAPLAPARLVPVLQLADGTVIGETLAIAETLAERHPEAALWPADPSARATARWLCAEMATGFMALRGDCPMQLHRVYKGFQPSEAVLTDLERLNTLWSHARKVSGAETGWLFGEISAADVFFAPVAARVVGYDLPVNDQMRAYCDAWLSHPSFVKWRQTGLEQDKGHNAYPQDLPAGPWPSDL